MARLKKQIDPRLLAQLEATAGTKVPALVEAVVQLRPEASTDVAPAPERTDEIVRTILSRVTGKLGVDPADFNIFPNLGSFVISASREYLRELLGQPEVQGALANRPPDPKASFPSRRPPSARKPGRR